MIDMSTWDRLEADVLDDLVLDPKNVRLDTDVNAPEADIMADLFRNEKALDLVEGIVKVGYLSHEVPIVLRRGRSRQFIVAEGNRRVAALKAIQNPFLVPEFAARISALAGQLEDRSALRKIAIIRAPNQDSADQLIAALHTGDTRVKWNPARQAAFFEAQIDQGKTLGQLRAQYPTIDVEKYVLRSGVIRLFKSVTYSDPAYSDLLAKRGTVTSSLERIYESKPFIDLIGLNMDADGDVTHTLTSDVFAEMAELIMSGIAEGDINTRTIGRVTSPRYQKLISDLTTIEEGAPAPAATLDTSSDSTAESDQSSPGDTSGSSSGNSANGSGGESSGSASGPTTGVGTGRNRKVAPTLDIGSLKVPNDYPSEVSVLLDELSAINVVRFPNATFDLMRTFLEKSIKSRAEVMGFDLRPKGHQGFVYLRNCLAWMQSELESSGPVYAVQVIKQMQSGKVLDFVGSSDFLNALNHNHHVAVSTAEVRQSWNQMKTILTEVFR